MQRCGRDFAWQDFTRRRSACGITSESIHDSVWIIFNFARRVCAHAQLPATSLARAGFDPARLDVLHAMTKRFVEEGQHAGVITLLARKGRLVDFQTYGYRDLERKLPMQRDTICRVYSMSKIITS